MKFRFFFFLITTLLFTSSEKTIYKRFLALNQSKSNNHEKNLNKSLNNINETNTTILNLILNTTNATNDTNTTDSVYIKKKKDSDDGNSTVEKEPGTYLLSALILFLILAVYILMKMHDYKETKGKESLVLKFIWFANNGALIGAAINFIFFQNVYMAASVLILSGIIFLIGAIYYIVKYSKKCDKEKYYDNEYLCGILKLPLFVFHLLLLTEPCCRIDTYTVEVYEDGSTRSNEACVKFFNGFVMMFKILITVLTIIAYYIFTILFIIFWLIAKLCYLSEKKQINQTTSPSSQNESVNKVNVPTNINNNALTNANINNKTNNNINDNKQYNNYNNSAINVSKNKIEYGANNPDLKYYTSAPEKNNQYIN